MCAQTAKKHYSNDKTKILIKNFHPVLKPPLTRISIFSVIKKVFRGEKSAFGSLSISFVRDSDLRKINWHFLRRDENTDIITFPYEGDRKNIEGEILISLDSVRKNGKYYGSGFRKEFKRVLIHGCLHLSGYDDRTRRQKELIRSRENFYLGG